MKKKFIRIKDISDIDTSRISVYDLNNRYIDNNGNLYGVKYNRLDKKIEIVKLIRATAEDSINIHQKIQESNKEEIISHKNTDEFEDIEEEEFYQETSFSKNEDFDIFEIEETIRAHLVTLYNYKDRLLGIIKNLTNSNVFSRENKEENHNFGEIIRSLEIDAIQKISEVENYEKEITNYPRPVSYYITKMDNSGRTILESLTLNTQKAIEYIFIYEMSQAIKSILKIISNNFEFLSDLMSNKEIDKMRELSPYEKQCFHDSLTSIKNTKEEIEVMRTNLKTIWKDIRNINNF